MSNHLIRDALIASSIFAGGFYLFTHRPLIYEFIGIHPQDIVDARAAREEAATITTAAEVTTVSLGGSAASIRKAQDGQFWTDARVNSSHIRFLVDTGASVIALTPTDARKAGFNPKVLEYTAPINTAAGQIMAAPITLKFVSVGNVSVRNVRAVIIPQGLTHSLLGMSFLGELQRVEATKETLILRQ